LISAEVLCSDVAAILEGVMKEPSLIEQLLSYLEKPAPLHSVRSNLVCRVIGFLLDKKPSETLALMQAKDKLVDRFLDHLDNASVVELLQKVVGSEPSTENAETALFQWLKDSQLINKLTCKLDPKLDSDTHMNAAGALVDMSRVPAMAQALETEDILNSLLAYVLANPTPKPLASNSAMISGLTVIIELLRHSPPLKFEPVSEYPLDKLPLVYSIILKELDKFKAILAINSSNEVISTTMGEIEPLGFARLKVLELVSVLSQSNYQCVDNVLMEKDMFSLVLDLFFHFRWNNVLHAHVVSMIRRGLEGANEDIKEHLLKHARLPKRIVDAEKENTDALKEPRGVRRGYMGHLVQLASELKKQAFHSKVIETLLEQDEEWKTFRDGFLKQRNEIEAHLLGGRATQMDSSSSGDDDDDDDDDLGQDDDDDGDIERQFIDATPDESDFNQDGPFDEPPHGSTSSDEDSEEEEIEGETPPQAPEEKA
jgi:hypothetical protein